MRARLPEEFAVHKSKRVALLFVAFGALLCCLLLYQTIAEYVQGVHTKKLLGVVTSVFIFGLMSLLIYVEAAQHSLALVVFRRGLFWPTLQREVIPWLHVESVRVTHIGRGRSVVVVFSEEFEAGLATSSRVMPVIMKIEALIGWRGRILSVGMLDHSVDEIAHVIDDWIRHGRGLEIKPPFPRGPFAAIADWIRGRDEGW